ncbi:BatA domain-containing protein [uncultured Aquimarina sp.]|uniref:BatA domain-containing protein n=1 Tax=uncultured Aquimarina sp. TaxID=575652 RepID=UPI00262059CB|nr:BatA domain-containing protein [uncultured Aquimarina sp.]
MSFLYPTYLWALLGLIIPIVIHFWSKREGKTIKVGSTKLLSESDSKQSKSIQLNEIFLLMLRMLLLGVLVLLISGIRINKKETTLPVTYLFEPSLLKHDRVMNILDTIDEGESLRLLASTFPLLDKDELDVDQKSIPNYWQLAKEMENLKTDSIVVFTSAFLSGLKGARPTIYKNINWISIDRKESYNYALKAIKEEDTTQVLMLRSNSDQLTFIKEKVSNEDLEFSKNNDSIVFTKNDLKQRVPVSNFSAKKVALFYDDSLLDQKRLIKASLQAIAKYTDRTIEIKEFTNTADTITGFDLIIWLSTDPVPNTNSKLLVFNPDEYAKRSIETTDASKIFYLTELLTVERSIDQHFSEQLLEVLDDYQDIKNDIAKHDRRVIEVSEITPLVTSKQTIKKQFALLDISKWLWLVFGTLLIAERCIAKYRKQ